MKVDALGQAIKMMDRVEEAFNAVEAPIDIEVALQIAQACTLIAQAELLKRIADALHYTTVNGNNVTVASILDSISRKSQYD
jgi:seryl-tRNA(Sec) selenium transferase